MEVRGNMEAREQTATVLHPHPAPLPSREREVRVVTKSRVDQVRNVLAWIFLALGVAIFLWRIFAPTTPETLTNYQLYTMLKGDIQAYFGGLLFVLVGIFLKKE